jgi:ribosome-associated protein
MRNFNLKNDYIELMKLIKLLGFAETGGQGKMLIEQGKVLLNGQIELRKRAKLRNGDEVEISGRKVRIVSAGNSDS